MVDGRGDERAMDAHLHARYGLAADEGGGIIAAERDLDLGPYAIRTRSNHVFDYSAPTPEMVRWDDMAAGLLGEPRYANQVCRPYSVAEHLVLATRIASIIEPDVSAEALWAVFMHDAAEAYVKDIPSPLKRLLGEAYRKIERAVEAAIFERFAVNMEPHRKLVKECDRLAYLTERATLCGWTEVELPGRLGELVRDARADRALGVLGGPPLWPPVAAQSLFDALPWPKVREGVLSPERAFNNLAIILMPRRKEASP